MQLSALSLAIGRPGVAGPSASLALDFISGNQALDSRITFTRSTTGTRVNPSGTIESVAINAARFDYDPVTRAPRGLLIEEQRTNLVLNSALLNTQNVTVTAVAHTLTFYGTGQIVLSGASVATLAGTGAFPNRATLTFTPTAGTLTLTVTGQVLFGQLEVGAFDTSYIPTTAAQVTRAADIAAMTGTNFSSWYNASEGTIFAAFDHRGQTSALLSANDNTGNNRVQLNTGATVAAGGTVATLGVVQANLNTGTFTADAVVKAALAYKLNDFSLSVNGAAPVVDTAGTIPTVTQAQIGSRAGVTTVMTGHIQRIAFYPRRLSNTELQAITA